MKGLGFCRLKQLSGLILSCWLVAACGGGSGDSSPASPTSPSSNSGSGLRSSFNVGITPSAPPYYTCGTAGPATVSVMSKLNQFWQSQVQACSCQSDAYFYANCSGNAFVPLQIEIGYEWFDANFLDNMDQSTGSSLPADFVMAHEFGHNIQGQLALLTGVSIQMELQADCLGGFYVGSRISLGQITQNDLIQTFNSACMAGDPAGYPWYAPNAHGSCAQRVASIQTGIQGYLNGALPGQACPSS